MGYLSKKILLPLLIAILLFLFEANTYPKQSPKVIHVYVALCDNQSQGIVPVPTKIGNGNDPFNNLYWGALYGIKTHFKKSSEWTLLVSVKNPRKTILERCIFKHKYKSVYLVADAYQGNKIKKTIEDFLMAASGRNQEKIILKWKKKKQLIKAGGSSNVIVYVGHNGLMDFKLSYYPKKINSNKRQVIILACISKSYFKQPLKQAGASPLLWTTGLLAPEAYILKSALAGWINKESPLQIRNRAAKAYNKYQKCGLKGAKRLFSTGYK